MKGWLQKNYILYFKLDKLVNENFFKKEHINIIINFLKKSNHLTFNSKLNNYILGKKKILITLLNFKKPNKIIKLLKKLYFSYFLILAQIVELNKKINNLIRKKYNVKFELMLLKLDKKINEIKINEINYNNFYKFNKKINFSNVYLII